MHATHTNAASKSSRDNTCTHRYDAANVHPSELTFFPVPPDFHGKAFVQLFQYLVLKCMALPLVRLCCVFVYVCARVRVCERAQRNVQTLRCECACVRAGDGCVGKCVFGCAQGLYRSTPWKGISPKPYVITNPDPNMILQSADYVYTLQSPQMDGEVLDTRPRAHIFIHKRPRTHTHAHTTQTVSGVSGSRRCPGPQHATIYAGPVDAW